MKTIEKLSYGAAESCRAIGCAPSAVGSPTNEWMKFIALVTRAICEIVVICALIAARSDQDTRQSHPGKPK